MKNCKNHVEKLFENAPKTKRASELKDELLSNLNDKLNDLIASGQTEEQALSAVIDGIGDVDELIRGLRAHDVLSYSQTQEERKKSALVVTAAVGMYILSVIMLIFLISVLRVSTQMSFVVMLALCAAATCILVYHFMSRPPYMKSDDTLVEEFKEWKSHNSQSERIRKSISSILWMATVALYLIISFSFFNWGYSWIIFIVAAVIDRIIRLIFELRK